MGSLSDFFTATHFQVAPDQDYLFDNTHTFYVAKLALSVSNNPILMALIGLLLAYPPQFGGFTIQEALRWMYSGARVPMW